MAAVNIKFMSLTGKFETIREQTFEGPNCSNDALDAVIAHAKAGGYSNVKVVSGEDDGWRYTARTPGGRGGRNVAFGDAY